MSLLVSLVLLLGATETQTDWVGGPGVFGPLEHWTTAYWQSESINCNVSGQVFLTATSTPGGWTRHIIETHPSIDGHGGIATADFDGDGDLDAAGAIAGVGIRIYRNYLVESNTVSYSQVATLTGLSIPSYCLLWCGDLDRDGDHDIVVPCSTGVAWYEHTTGFNFTLHTIGSAAYNEPCCDVGDIDNDNDLDLVVGSVPLDLWRNNGDGTFTRTNIAPGRVERVKLGDLDNDNWLDLLNSGDVYINNQGLFPAQPAWRCPVPDVNGNWIRDFNNDGRVDILLTPNKKAAWYENDGSGRSFTEHLITNNDSFGDACIGEDLDLDGKTDVVGTELRVVYFRQLAPDNFQPVVVGNIRASHWAHVANVDRRPGGTDVDLDILTTTYDTFAWWNNLAANTRFATLGRLESSVLERPDALHWDSLLWTGTRPGGTTFNLYLRSGPTATAILTRPWRGPFEVPVGGASGGFAIADSTARGDKCFQYKVEMGSGTALSPALYDLSVRYTGYDDVGCTRLIMPAGTVDSGAAITPACSVYNYTSAIQNYNVRMKIGTGYSQTVAVGFHVPGARRYVTFPAWTALPPGQLAVSCSTELAADSVKSNDRRTGTVVVRRPGGHDVGVTRIIRPLGTLDSGAVVTPACSVYNWGGNPESYAVRLKIGTGYNATAQVSGHNPAARLYVTFPAWTALPVGIWPVTCSTELFGDDTPLDDKLGTVITVVRPGRDIALTRIEAPAGTLVEGTAVTPTVVLYNSGNATETYWVRLTVAPAWNETALVTGHLPGTTRRAFFPVWTAGDTGLYATRAWSLLATDANRANDTLDGTCLVMPYDSGWIRKCDVPFGPRNRYVKDGGALAYNEESGGNYVYAFKGNNTIEWYQYDTRSNTWATRESIPAIGSSGKRKTVKKGAALAQISGRIFGVKGNNSRELWEYFTATNTWLQKADVPIGTRNIKEGCGLAPVTAGGSDYLYLLKGSSTVEFYRYNLNTNAWETRASAPLGLSGKLYKNGSCLATDGYLNVFALKGSYNEFFAYDVNRDSWYYKALLPMVGTMGKKKKVKDGAGIAWHNDMVYALKGGNTQECWHWSAVSDTWVQFQDLPIGGGKRIRGGGALVFAEAPHALYALKGNNTVELWKYGLRTSGAAQASSFKPQALTGSSLLTPQSAIRISPNPSFRTPQSAIRIEYSLPGAGPARLRLYDVTGKLVTTLAAGHHEAGTHRLSLRAERSNLVRGIYLLVLDTRTTATTTKLIIE